MSLSSADRSFVKKRETRVKYWPFYGTFSLAILAAYGGWLWLKKPELINPWIVIERLEAGTLSESMMSIMAVMLPIVTATMLMLLFFVVLLSFVAFRNERRLICLIRRLETGAASEVWNDQTESRS